MSKAPRKKLNGQTARPKFPDAADLAATFGFAHLLFIRIWIDHVIPLENAYHEYNRKLATTENLIGLWLAAFFISPALYLLLKATSHPVVQKRKAAIFFVMALFATQVLAILSVYNATMDPFLAKNPFAFSVPPEIVWGLVLVSTLVFLTAFLFAAERTAAGLRILFVVIAPFPFFMTAETLQLKPFRPATTTTNSEQNKRTSGNRVVIVVFDELDYDLTFLTPNALQARPHLFALQNSSLHATKALPPSRNTLLSLPSYWFGRNIVSIEVGMNRPPQFSEFKGKGSFSLYEVPNLFAEAKKQGAAVGILGWSHPYCDLFGYTADICHQQSYLEYDHGDTWWESYGRALTRMALVLSRFGVTEPASMREAHVFAYQRMLKRSKQMVANSQLDLVFLHLPIPHEPTIYSRKTMKLRAEGRVHEESYDDNLALADLTIEELKQSMRSAGLWDKSHFIVLSDHTYRTKRPGETTEEVEARVRIPFIWHEAKGSSAKPSLAYTKPFSARVVMPLALELLNGRLNSISRRVAWLDDQRHLDRDFLRSAYREGKANCLEHPYRKDKLIFAMWTHFRESCQPARSLTSE